ncbi:major tail protein [Clostridium tertium]|uniref:major tail protein n=1 Tax=Clostridium tertium TaxID=1559 RepID=UPI0024B384DF|nr:major tail protein [Clostridium tertium]MDI9215997.1 hypothetical protein [Clostridium tertium]
MAKQQLSGVSVGLGKIRYSILEGLEGGTYSIPKELGDLISFTVTPTESSVSLWAGDRQVLFNSGITASGTFGVPSISNSDMVALFGLEMGSKGELIYKSNATKPTVALFIEQNNSNGVTDHISLWECKLQLSTKTGNTKTDSISHGTTEVSFEVIMPGDKIYMSVQSSDEDDFVVPTFETAPVKPTKKI